MPEVPALSVPDASLGGENIIIAKRRIVKVNLKHCLAIDVSISAMDVHKPSNQCIMACGKVLYLWDLEKLGMIRKYGRTTGSIHREQILTVQFNATGTRIVSAGVDKRIVVWNVKTAKTEKILEGHKGQVFQAEFSRDGERILSASDDGRVIVWDWHTGTVLLSYIRHPAAVRSVATFPEHPEKIVCGRNDGTITIWDLSVKGIVDNILPDPDWIHDGEEQSLVGWYGIHKHHSGAIMAVAVSPNGKYLASAASDHTTKLWNVVSYNKNVEIVQAELLDANQKTRALDAYIDVFDDRYDAQIKLKEFAGLMIGEVPIPTGYHADLLFTYRHEAAVLSISFNAESDIVATGSMDATCRLWSCRRGDLIFQINVPSAVSQVAFCPFSNDLYAVCENRMLVFEVHPSAREEELPEAWRLNAEAFYSGDNTRVKNTPDRSFRIDEDEGEWDPAVLADKKKVMNVEDLKQLISHGLVLPSFLDTLLSQFSSVDAEKLFFNMKKFKMQPNQLLRLLVNAKFHPRDVLKALSAADNAGVLFAAALSGVPISSLMIRLGYKPCNTEKEQIYLHLRDFNPELSLLETPLKVNNSRRTTAQVFSEGRGISGFSPGGGRRESEEYYIQMERQQQYYNQTDTYHGEMQGPQWGRVKPLTGDVVKYIPSEQLKLLKDFHGHREIKPIFMRQILVDAPKHPNFTPQSPIRDTTPWIPQRGAVSQTGVRFNETVTNSRGNNFANLVTRRNKRNTGASPPRPLPAKKELLGTSSKTVFNPDRYLKTMGMNVRFSSENDRGVKRGAKAGGMAVGQADLGMVNGNALNVGGAGPGHNNPSRTQGFNGSLIQGHVYAEPIAIRGSKNQEIKEQFVVGSGIALKEATARQFQFE
ncbi:Transducin beta-like protein 2 [Chytriomyces hyalinus]|nr:Transducin beta-like protein 2 [Chytriomyces hyalinus]